MSDGERPRSPSRLWYVAHIFFGPLTGIACFLKWSDENRKMANRHIVNSIWIPILIWGLVFGAMVATGMDLESYDI